MAKKQFIKPDPNCEFCHGDGVVYDSVPYGMGNTLMPSNCECVEEQADEDTEDIEFVYSLEVELVTKMRIVHNNRGRKYHRVEVTIELPLELRDWQFVPAYLYGWQMWRSSKDSVTVPMRLQKKVG